MLLHKKCKTVLYVDITQKYRLVSPGYTLSAKSGLVPGVVEITSSKSKEDGLSFYCKECGETISGRDQIESDIVAICEVCQKEKTLDDLFDTGYISSVCGNCLELAKSQKDYTETDDNFILGVLSGKMFTGKFPTLLTIVLKK